MHWGHRGVGNDSPDKASRLRRDALRIAAEEVVNFLYMDVNEEQLVDGLKLLEGAIENLRDALEGKS